jgi:hypothetical protein
LVNTEKINIGITLSLKSNNDSIWVNGIKMNAIFLADLLQKSSKNYNVYLINTSPKIDAESQECNPPWDTSKYPVYQYKNIIQKTDLLIQLGTSVGVDTIKRFKKLPVENIEKKVITYRCGNNYVIGMENAMFKEPDKAAQATFTFGYNDDIWFVPQQEKHNKHFLDECERVDSKPVPFVWHHMFIDKINEQLKSYLPYEPKNKPKSVVSLEPNFNVVKYTMIPMLAANKVYRNNNSLIDKFIISSGDKVGKNKAFTSISSKLELHKDGKLKSTGRHPTPQLLGLYTDIVVSHQWDNPLNYVYLDCLYMRYPLVHNAYMIEDAGYYYPDFNIEKASNKLLEAIENHDNHTEEYDKRSEKVLSRYLADENPELITTYDKLIDSLWNPSQIKNFDYNYKTNLYNS